MYICGGFVFFSFEVSVPVLKLHLNEDAYSCYYTFFIFMSVFLILFEKVKMIRIPIFFLKGLRLECKSKEWYSGLYIMFFFLMMLQLTVRSMSGGLVLGQESTNSDFFLSLINYFLYFLGFTHTGFLNYIGLIAVGVVIKLKFGCRRYIALAYAVSLLMTILTTQKSYLLYALISFIIVKVWVDKISNKKIFLLSLILISLPFPIYILNAIRNVYLHSEGGGFDYFSINTIIWYMSIRLDYAQSTNYILGTNFEDFYQFITNILKSFLFFIPKTFLFGDEIYSIKLARLVGFSSNELAGITVTPFAQIYGVMGTIGTMFFALFTSILIRMYAFCFNFQPNVKSIIYVLFFVPFVYFSFISQALSESIYIFMRNLVSLNLALLMYIVIYWCLSESK